MKIVLGLGLLGLLAGTVRAGEVSPFGSALDKAAGASVVVGAEGWLYLPSELRFLSRGTFWGEAAAAAGVASNPEHRDPLPALEDFARQLEEAGVRLLLVPVPPKALIYPEPLGVSAEQAQAAGSALDTFYTELCARGMHVLDVRADLQAAKADGEVYCRTDSHWSGRGLSVVARRIAEKLREQGWTREPAKDWTVNAREVAIQGDLARLAGRADRETVKLDVVADGAGAPITPDPASPIVLLGDSHTLVFQAGGDMHASGAGLADHLSREVGRAVDLLGVRGSGATTSRISLMRRVRADAQYLPGKFAVVWCFAARDFTEADGWRKVPLWPAQ